MRIILQLPQGKRKKHARPKRCLHCQGETFQRWGVEKRRIGDVKTGKTPRFDPALIA